MRWLAYASVVMATTPFIASALYGDEVTFLISLAFASLVVVIGAIGIVRGNTLPSSLISMVLLLLTLALSHGYIVYTAHTYILYIAEPGLTIVGYCIVLVELSVLWSMMYRAYLRMRNELVNKGYGELEVSVELGGYVSEGVKVSLVAAAASLLAYLAVSVASVPIVDPITAIVVFTIVYLAIMSYVSGRWSR